MNRDGAGAEGSASRPRERPVSQPPNPRRKPKKKLDRFSTPIQAPYLVTAPPSLMAPPPESDANLILPSTYVRSLSNSSPAPRPPNPSNPSWSGSIPRQSYAANFLSPPSIMPSGSTSAPRPSSPAARGYAANLLSPPSIMPGGRPSEPLIQTVRQPQSGRNTRLGSGNASQLSLPRAPSPNAQGEGRTTPRPRRRRVVQESLRRRRSETVSTVEEGRAIGLARGASMRRVNLWDDLPDGEDRGDDPPPPFPFPTASNVRAPPTFNEPSLPPIPDSPPPSFDAAMAIPLNASPAAGATPMPPSPRPVTASPALATPAVFTRVVTPPMPEESSSSDDDDDAAARLDRRQWNADILAGYTLAERVAREAARQEARTPQLEAEARRVAGDAERQAQEEAGRRDDEARRRADEARHRADAEAAQQRQVEEETRRREAEEAEAARVEAEDTARREAEATARREAEAAAAAAQRQVDEAARLRRREEAVAARRLAEEEAAMREATAASLRQAEADARLRRHQAEESARRVEAEAAATRRREDAAAAARRAEIAAAATRRYEVEEALREATATQLVSSADLDAVRREVTDAQTKAVKPMARAELVTAAKDALAKKGRLTPSVDEGLQPTLPVQFFHGSGSGFVRQEEPGVVYDLVPSQFKTTKQGKPPTAVQPVTTPPRSTSSRAVVAPSAPLFSSPAPDYFQHAPQPGPARHKEELLESSHDPSPSESSTPATRTRSGSELVIPSPSQPPPLPSRPPADYINEYRASDRRACTAPVPAPEPGSSPHFVSAISAVPRSSFSSTESRPNAQSTVSASPDQRPVLGPRGTSGSSGPRPYAQSSASASGSSSAATTKGQRRLSGPRSLPTKEKGSIPPSPRSQVSRASSKSSKLEAIVASGSPSRSSTPLAGTQAQSQLQAPAEHLEASSASGPQVVSPHPATSPRLTISPSPAVSPQLSTSPRLASSQPPTSPQPPSTSSPWHEGTPTQSRRPSIVSTDGHPHPRPRSGSVSGPRSMPKRTSSVSDAPPVPAIPPRHRASSAQLQAFTFPAPSTHEKHAEKPTPEPDSVLSFSPASMSSAAFSTQDEVPSLIKPPKRKDSLSASDGGSLRRPSLSSSNPWSTPPPKAPSPNPLSSNSLDPTTRSTFAPVSSSRTQSPVVVSQTPPPPPVGPASPEHETRHLGHKHNASGFPPTVPPKDGPKPSPFFNAFRTVTDLSPAQGLVFSSPANLDEPTIPLIPTSQGTYQGKRRQENDSRRQASGDSPAPGTDSAPAFHRLSIGLGRRRSSLLKHVLSPVDDSEQGGASPVVTSAGPGLLSSETTLDLLESDGGSSAEESERSTAAGKRPAPPRVHRVPPPNHAASATSTAAATSNGTSAPRPPSPGLNTLMESSSALLNLLELVTSSGGESSAQGAAKAAARRAMAHEIREQLDIEQRIRRSSIEQEQANDLALALALAEGVEDDVTASDHALAAALAESDSPSASVTRQAPRAEWPALVPSPRLNKGKGRAPPPKPQPKPKRLAPPPPPTPRKDNEPKALPLSPALSRSTTPEPHRPTSAEPATATPTTPTTQPAAKPKPDPRNRDTQYMLSSFPIPPVPSSDSSIPLPPAPQLPPILPSRPLSQFAPRPQSNFTPGDAPPTPSVPPSAAPLPSAPPAHPSAMLSSGSVKRRQPPPVPPRIGAPLIQLDDEPATIAMFRRQQGHQVRESFSSSSSSSLLDHDPAQPHGHAHAHDNAQAHAHANASAYSHAPSQSYAGSYAPSQATSLISSASNGRASPSTPMRPFTPSRPRGPRLPGRREPPPVPPRPWARAAAEGPQHQSQSLSSATATASEPGREAGGATGCQNSTALETRRLSGTSRYSSDARRVSTVAVENEQARRHSTTDNARLSVELGHRPQMLREVSGASSSSSMFNGVRLDAQGRLIDEGVEGREGEQSPLLPRAGPLASPSEATPISLRPEAQTEPQPPAPPSPDRQTSPQRTARPNPSAWPVSDLTDVDLYASRAIGHANEYEALNHLISFLGPAKDPGATPAQLATLVPAPVIVDSRRMNAAGKVKIKLSVLGVRVTNCPVCLAQYRGDDAAVLLPKCGHIAHESCARRWFREGRGCMVCREGLGEDGGGE